MTEQIVEISELRALTFTCNHCGVAFSFEVLRTSPLRATCPVCDQQWADVGLARSLADALASFQVRDSHPRVSFRLPVASSSSAS